MRLLCLNVGSSSLKWAVLTVEAEGATQTHAHGQDNFEATGPDLEAAVGPAIDKIFAEIDNTANALDGIGHRFVFGGTRYIAPTELNADVLAKLDPLAAFAPLHVPVQLASARYIARRWPQYRQVAAFDTAFHAAMPAVAQRFPLPQAALGDDIRRFGFHGLSYEYLTKTFPQTRQGRVIIAHLGSGASVVALCDGKPQDTTMGLTPLGGIMMGTRPGDLDPGLALYLLRSGRYTVDEIDALFERGSGLKGVSELTSDIHVLLERRTTDAKAYAAIELFTYLLRKHIGALVAVLEGLDTLVFTAGIGEHSAEIRAEVCAGFGYLQLDLDSRANEVHAQKISSQKSGVLVAVYPTDENSVIAQHAAGILDPI